MHARSTTTGKYLLLGLIAAFFLFPILWIVIQSLKTPLDSIAVPPKIFYSPTLHNYQSVLTDMKFLNSIRDSLIIASLSVVLTLAIGVLFAYALARLKFRGSYNIGFFVLSTMILPPIVIIVPFSFIFYHLHLLDSYLGVIVAHVLLNLALVIWVIRSFLLKIPIEIEEAAMIDGCTRMQTFWKIVFPVCSSGLTAVAILSFIFSWNDLVFSLALTSSKIRTLPVFVATGYTGYIATNWGGLSAAGIITIIPTIVLILATRKYLVTGLSFGSVGKK